MQKATWFDLNRNYNRNIWNHYKTVGPRTNNHCEGFNNRFNKLTGSHQNIYKLINIIKKVELEASLKYNNYSQGKVIYQSKILYQKKTGEIEKSIQLQKSKKSTLDQLLAFLSVHIGSQEITKAINANSIED